MSNKKSIISKCDDIIDSLMKRSPSLSQYDKAIDKYEKLLKKLKNIKDMIEKSDVEYEQSSRVPVQGLPAGWTRALQPDEDGSITFHHPVDDPITIERHQGGFRIRHRGGVVNKAPNMVEAGKMVGDYVRNLPNKSINIYNRPSPNMPMPGMPIPTKMGSKSQVMKSHEDDARTATENMLAGQLADLLHGKSMLGAPITGSTNVAKSIEMQQTKDNWLQEASKPISHRFNSEEEEADYWNSIRVSDREDEDYGY